MRIIACLFIKLLRFVGVVQGGSKADIQGRDIVRTPRLLGYLIMFPSSWVETRQLHTKDEIVIVLSAEYLAQRFANWKRWMLIRNQSGETCGSSSEPFHPDTTCRRPTCNSSRVCISVELPCLFSLCVDSKTTVLPFTVALCPYRLDWRQMTKAFSPETTTSSLSEKPVQFFLHTQQSGLLAPFTSDLSTTFPVAQLLYLSTRFPRDQLEPSDDRNVPVQTCECAPFLTLPLSIDYFYLEPIEYFLWNLSAKFGSSRYFIYLSSRSLAMLRDSW